jgi:hypothetical protein
VLKVAKSPIEEASGLYSVTKKIPVKLGFELDTAVPLGITVTVAALPKSGKITESTPPEAAKSWCQSRVTEASRRPAIL